MELEFLVSKETEEEDGGVKRNCTIFRDVVPTQSPAKSILQLRKIPFNTSQHQNMGLIQTPVEFHVQNGGHC